MSELEIQDVGELSIEDTIANPEQAEHEGKVAASKEPWFLGLVPNKTDEPTRHKPNQPNFRTRFFPVAVGDTLEVMAPYTRKAKVVQVLGNGCKVNVWDVVTVNKRFQHPNTGQTMYRETQERVEWQEVWGVKTFDMHDPNDERKTWTETHCVVVQDGRPKDSRVKNAPLVNNWVLALKMENTDAVQPGEDGKRVQGQDQGHRKDAQPQADVQGDGGIADAGDVRERPRRQDLLAKCKVLGIKAVEGKPLIQATAEALEAAIAAKERPDGDAGLVQ